MFATVLKMLLGSWTGLAATGVGAHALTSGSSTNFLLDAVLKPVFGSVTGIADEALGGLGKMFESGDITKWITEHKELAIAGGLGAGMLGLLGPQAQQLSTYAALAYGAYYAYNKGLLGKFANAVGMPAGGSPTIRLQRELAYN